MSRELQNQIERLAAEVAQLRRELAARPVRPAQRQTSAGDFILDIRWNSSSHAIEVTYDGDNWVQKIPFDPDCP